MNIDLISYLNNLSNKDRLALTTEIINNSNADLILFAGHTIGFVNDIEELRYRITNAKTEAILELKDINSGKFSNCLYRIKNGKLENMFSHQLFTQSIDIEGNYQLAEILINELSTRRTFKIKNKSFLVLQCGELNILRNLQSKNNKVEFRLSDNKYLKTQFEEILNKTNVILNPIHTPMGNQGKMTKRREFLSNKNKYYFSTSNTTENSNNLNAISLQYAYFNKKPLETQEIDCKNKFIRKSFKIE
jgi:hypothetical protein